MPIQNQSYLVDVRLPDTSPADIQHNHGTRLTHIVAAGYSATAPDYHLFHCTALSSLPHEPMELVPFNPEGFSHKSKGGNGGCSRRRCPGEAVKMSSDGRRAYCEDCAGVAKGLVPCPWTSLIPCNKRLDLDQGPSGTVCVVCRE